MQAIILEVTPSSNVEHLLASMFFYVQTAMLMNENNKFAYYLTLGSKRCRLPY